MLAFFVVANIHLFIAKKESKAALGLNFLNKLFSYNTFCENGSDSKKGKIVPALFCLTFPISCYWIAKFFLVFSQHYDGSHHQDSEEKYPIDSDGVPTKHNSDQGKWGSPEVS